MSYRWGWVWFIAAFAALRDPVRGALLRAAGDLLPVRLRATHGARDGADDRLLRATDPQAVWQAGGATALFIAGFGAAGYATRRDLSALARVAFWALLGLIGFGILTIFVNIPNGTLIYAILGLVIFAAFTLIDFQRLRRTKDIRAAPLLAASIFLDVLNVFLLFLQLFGRR